MKAEETRVRRRPGRPMSFDRDAALDRAVLVFWRHGYETASVADLTAAMGITPPSLYAAFGDKKGLFLAAVDRYWSGGPVTAEGMIDGSTTARNAAATLLLASAAAFTGPNTPPGCLLASAAATGSDAAADVRAVVAGIHRALEDSLRQKAVADVAAGRLPADADVGGLAALTVAVIQGMSTLARDGADRAKLLAVADAALRAWPDPRP